MKRPSQAKSQFTTAFTVVELTIVVIVIAILAGIVIVGYSGVTKNAKATAVKSDLQQAMTKLGVQFAKNGEYPSDFSGDAALVSENTNFIYSRSNAENFCLTGISSEFDTAVFHIDQEKVVREGYCDGHEPIPVTVAACFGFNSTTKQITIYRNTENGSPGAPACPKKVNIPSTINGHNVESIAASVFSGKALERLVLPDTLITIGDMAFMNNQLTSVVIPSSVTSIGMAAFATNQLTSVTIPNSITAIGSQVFQSNQLASVTIPNSVLTIGDQAFMNNQLTSVVIPSSVTSIGNNSFRNNQITSLTLSTGLITIGAATFQANQLASITIPNSVTTIGAGAFRENQLTSVTLSSSMTAISDSAFRTNQLTSIVIPNNITTISGYAFQANQLNSVTIPDSVTSIGGSAFFNNKITYIFTMAPATIGAQAFRATGYTSVCYFPAAISVTSGACNTVYMIMPP